MAPPLTPAALRKLRVHRKDRKPHGHKCAICGKPKRYKAKILDALYKKEEL
jgi:ribosomal protein L34E